MKLCKYFAPAFQIINSQKHSVSLQISINFVKNLFSVSLQASKNSRKSHTLENYLKTKRSATKRMPHLNIKHQN